MCVRLFLSGEHNTLEGSIGLAESGMWNVCNFKQVMPMKHAKQLVYIYIYIIYIFIYIYVMGLPLYSGGVTGALGLWW